MPWRRQNAVSAWYDRVAPSATSSSWTRTRLPLQRAKCRAIWSRSGAAFSARASGGTASLPLPITLRTAARDRPSARAMARVPWPCSRSLRIAARVLWSSITDLLLQAGEERIGVALGLQVTAPDLVALRGRESPGQALSQAPMQAAGDAGEGPEVVGELLGRARAGRLGPARLLLDAQEEPRVREHQLPRTPAAKPAGVQRLDLARARPPRCQRRRQPQAVRRLGPGQRHQVLHRRLRR